MSTHDGVHFREKALAESHSSGFGRHPQKIEFGRKSAAVSLCALGQPAVANRNFVQKRHCLTAELIHGFLRPNDRGLPGTPELELFHAAGMADSSAEEFIALPCQASKRSFFKQGGRPPAGHDRIAVILHAPLLVIGIHDSLKICGSKRSYHNAGVGERITAFAGVPSWNLALRRRVLEYTGRKNLLEVWPRLEMFAHGGVEFAPYRTSFEELIPSEKMKYMETYNASEGFFAMADDPSRSDMLLMLDYGTFFEFRSGTQIVPLEGVECGKVYAVLITSNNGLWRYEIGDTVEFTSTNPYRIRFAGRTRQYINVFGEELIVDNAEHALLAACRKTGAVVSEYSVAPCYMSLRERGAHEWIVEFEREPDSLERFAEALDGELRAVNSDYDAKRRTTLERQRLTVVERGRFLAWMRARGKNKVPRLVNDRRVADEILAFQTEQAL